MPVKDIFSFLFFYIFGGVIRKYKSYKVIQHLEFFNSPYVDYDGKRFYSNDTAKGSTYYYNVSYDNNRVVLYKPNGLDIIDIINKPFGTEKVVKKPLNMGDSVEYYYKCNELDFTHKTFFKFVNSLVYKGKIESGTNYHSLIRDNVGLDEYKIGRKVRSWGYSHKSNVYANNGYYDGSNPISRYYDHHSNKAVSYMDDSKVDSSESYNGHGGKFGGSGAGSSWDSITSGSSSSSSSGGSSSSSSSDYSSSSSSSGGSD